MSVHADRSIVGKLGSWRSSSPLTIFDRGSYSSAGPSRRLAYPEQSYRVAKSGKSIQIFIWASTDDPHWFSGPIWRVQRRKPIRKNSFDKNFVMDSSDLISANSVHFAQTLSGVKNQVPKGWVENYFYRFKTPLEDKRNHFQPIKVVLPSIDSSDLARPKIMDLEVHVPRNPCFLVLHFWHSKLSSVNDKSPNEPSTVIYFSHQSARKALVLIPRTSLSQTKNR